ncbi:RNA-binding S4 domain-containing protein [bacterium]|nr:RNA-binding S4 domain-containing protein [bacterium]
MRLDQFLKISRLVKQRSMAKRVCDAGLVSVLGRSAKAGLEIRVGDELTLNMRDRFLRVTVIEIPTGNVHKEQAHTLYEIVEERDVSAY